MRVSFFLFLLASFVTISSLFGDEDSFAYDAQATDSSRFAVGKVQNGLPEGLSSSELIKGLNLPADNSNQFGWFCYGDDHSRSVALLRTDPDSSFLFIDLNRNKTFEKNERLKWVDEKPVWETSLSAEFVTGRGQYLNREQKIHIGWNESLERFELLTLGAMVGTTDLDGQTRATKYIDHNSNGRWFDLADRFLVDTNGDGKLNPISERFACRTICLIERKQFAIGGMKTGFRLSLKEITERGTILPTVSFMNKAEILELSASLASESGIHIRVEQIDKPIVCPIGEYHVESLRMKVKGEGKVYEFVFASLNSPGHSKSLDANGQIELNLLGKLKLTAIRLVNVENNRSMLSVSPLLSSESGLYLVDSSCGKRETVNENRLAARSLFAGEEFDLGSSGFS